MKRELQVQASVSQLQRHQSVILKKFVKCHEPKLAQASCKDTATKDKSVPSPQFQASISQLQRTRNTLSLLITPEQPQSSAQHYPPPASAKKAKRSWARRSPPRSSPLVPPFPFSWPIARQYQGLRPRLHLRRLGQEVLADERLEWLWDRSLVVVLGG